MYKQICIFDINSFQFNHSINDLPSDISTHMHDCYELFFFISGDVTYYIEGRAYKLNKNDLIITNNRELHRIVFNSSEIYERKFIHFKQEYISFLQTDEYNLLGFLEKRKLGFFNKIAAEDISTYGIDKYFEEIEKQANKNSPESQIMIKTLLVQILVSINEIFSKKQNLIVGSFESDKKIVSILEFINNNFHEKITLESLENSFYINKFYLCHIFKKNTGFAVSEYIIYKRIIKAKELLGSKMPVLEVVSAVGFSDYSNFYKAFKKIVGLSPKKYMKL